MPVDAGGSAGGLCVLMSFQLFVAECNLPVNRKQLLMSSRGNRVGSSTAPLALLSSYAAR